VATDVLVAAEMTVADQDADLKEGRPNVVPLLLLPPKVWIFVSWNTCVNSS
jgi:hypothetical protein